MEMQWLQTAKGVKFRTGMHFRDNDYPIKIRRYPAEGSMVTDAQRIGVVKGQFIRAQRLCSVMQTFKLAVQQVVQAAMRRGYKRKELDRVWGKFLVQWWKAQEVRRGELRAWFRRMSARMAELVRQEWANKASRGEDRKQPLGRGECPNKCLNHITGSQRQQFDERELPNTWSQVLPISKNNIEATPSEETGIDTLL